MKQAILGIFRHILTTAGGVAVANGTVAESEVQTLIGAAVIVAGIVWSVVEKRFR